MIPSISFFKVSLFCLSVLTFVTSCVSAPEAVKLDEAACLMAEQPDSAYSLLRSIDSRTFRRGSENEARYALLCTRAQYRNYDDAPNDSLISIAVDYYEENGSEEDKFYAYLYQGIVRNLLNDIPRSSSSLLRAMMNSERVKDHYALGQMYSYLCRNNSFSHCSDEEEYARKAYHEYSLHGEMLYILDATVSLALAEMHANNYESCFALCDSCIRVASNGDYEYLNEQILSIKASCAIFADSIDLAFSTYSVLRNLNPGCLSVTDLGNIAFLYAKKQMQDSALYYLHLSEDAIRSEEERHHYWTSALWTSESLHDVASIIACQDSLIHFQEGFLNEALIHTSIAEQKDYSNWHILKLEKIRMQKNNTIMLLLIILLLVLLFFCVALYLNKSQIVKQAEKITQLQIELRQKVASINEGLSSLMSHPVLGKFHTLANESKGLRREDWEFLNELFHKNIPYFETSLRKLTILSETEWHACMLLKVGYSPGEMAVLMNRSSATISTIRSRLYFKVHKKKGRAVDWDAFVHSI